MGKAYDEIMEQVEVTEEMQARILSNIRTQKIHREKKILRYRKPLAYAAAGLLLIMVGVSYLPKVQKNGPETESEQFFVGNGYRGMFLHRNFIWKSRFPSAKSFPRVFRLPWIIRNISPTGATWLRSTIRAQMKQPAIESLKVRKIIPAIITSMRKFGSLRRMVFLSRSREKTVLTGWRSGREAAIPILSVWKREPMRLPS